MSGDVLLLRCPACGAQNDNHECTDGVSSPGPGDTLVCCVCLTASVLEEIDGSLWLREMTEDEHCDLPALEMQELLKARGQAEAVRSVLRMKRALGVTP